MNVAEDVRAIRAGEGVRRGNTVLVNGRRYGIKGTGQLFPIAGVGIHALDRAAFRALMTDNDSGMTAEAEAELDRWRIGEEARQAARAAWQAGQRGTR